MGESRMKMCNSEPFLMRSLAYSSSCSSLSGGLHRSCPNSARGCRSPEASFSPPWSIRAQNKAKMIGTTYQGNISEGDTNCKYSEGQKRFHAGLTRSASDNLNVPTVCTNRLERLELKMELISLAKLMYVTMESLACLKMESLDIKDDLRALESKLDELSSDAGHMSTLNTLGVGFDGGKLQKAASPSNNVGHFRSDPNGCEALWPYTQQIQQVLEHTENATRGSDKHIQTSQSQDAHPDHAPGGSHSMQVKDGKRTPKVRWSTDC